MDGFSPHRDLRNTLFLAALLAVATLVFAACAGQSPGSAVVPPLSTGAPAGDALVEHNDQEPAGMLPTPAATLLPPVSPTPAPTLAQAMGTTAVDQTRAAALHPPTPPIVGASSSSPIFAEPMPTPSGVYSWTLKVPILMYHYISEPPAGADVYRVDLSVTPDAFRQQMQFLRDNGYTPVDFYELTTAIVDQTQLPEKPVLLTFDDGYIDNYEEAFPVLREFGFKGTFFVVSEFIDQGREEYMDWGMIEEMAGAGQRIESHSRTHPNLTTKDRDGLIWELLGSQETIAAHIGYRPRYFCYPGGDYNDETIQVLRELDYWGAVTTENGSWHNFDNRYEWHRIRMRNTTTLEEFGRLLDLEGTISGKPRE